MSDQPVKPDAADASVIPDETTIVVAPDVMPTMSDVSEAVADLTVTTSEIVRRIKSAVSTQVQSLGEQIYAPVGRILAWIESELGCVKATPGDVYARCHAKLDQQICGLTECATKYQAILERAARKARRQSPCAPQTTTGGKDDGVILGADKPPPVAPTMPMQDISILAGLWLVSDSNGVAVALDQLPAEWWHPGSGQPWYVSMTRDDHAVCMTPILRAVEDGCSVVGDLYVCSLTALPDGCAEQILVMLGVPPDAIYTVPPRTQAPPQGDAPSKGIIDDLRNLLPDVPPLPPIPPIALPDVTNISLPGLGDLAALIQAVRDAAANIGALVQWVRDIVAWVTAWIAQLHWPNQADVCGALGPIYEYLGIPDDAQIGCNSFQAAVQRLLA